MKTNITPNPGQQPEDKAIANSDKNLQDALYTDHAVGTTAYFLEQMHRTVSEFIDDFINSCENHPETRLEDFRMKAYGARGGLNQCLKMDTLFNGEKHNEKNAQVILNTAEAIRRRLTPVMPVMTPEMAKSAQSIIAAICGDDYAKES